MNRTNGIIALVDILGYSAFMENNDVGENTLKILELVNSLPKTEKEFQLESFGDDHDKKTLKAIESIQFMVFSDSILFSMPFTDSKDNETKTIDYAIAFICLSSLFKRFMDYGLPIRGAVSCGEFLTLESCFAGKPIIDAYKHGNKLNCAGIVLDVHVLADVVSLVTEDKTRREMLALNILKVKSKKGKTEKYNFVSPFLSYSEEERLKLSDQRELAIYITKSFTAHNKGLTESAKEKLDNTIELYEQVFKYKKKE